MRALFRTLLLLLLVALMIVAHRDADTAEKAGEKATELLLAYPLDPEVRFGLEAGEQEVRLDTWLALPDGWAADARVTAPYCLGVTVTAPDGGVVLDQRHWLSTRAAWEEDPAGRGAPTVDLGEPLGHPSADRLLDIGLEGLVPEGGVLTVRTVAAPPGATVLLLAFREGRRDGAARLRVQTEGTSATRDGLARRVGLFEWAAVPMAWRAGLATPVWERLGALADGDLRPRTVRLRTTGEAPPWEEVPAWGLPLQPGAAAAWNVVGPATLEATWTTLEGAPTPAPRAAIRVVRADGSDAIPAKTGGWRRSTSRQAWPRCRSPWTPARRPGS